MLSKYAIIINSEPRAVSALYRQGIQRFVRQLNRTTEHGARISRLKAIPVVTLCDIFMEMASYPALWKTLHRELSDPDLFMPIYLLNGTYRTTLLKCLRQASRLGQSVLPDLANNLCKSMSQEKSAHLMTRTTTEAILELGSYMNEAGFSMQSVKMLSTALQVMPQEQSLRIECILKLLRAEGSALLREEADKTCSKLLEMIEGNTDCEVRLKVYLEVANHHSKFQQFVESDRWTLKALQLISEATPAELIIEFFQLKALHLFHYKQIESANLLIRQAISRARSAFGCNHRRYADTLYTYGVILLKTNHCFKAIQILLELLGIITSLHGKFTPHVGNIESYLAFGFNRLSVAAVKISPSRHRVAHSIRLAERIMHWHELGSHFEAVKALILTRQNEFSDVTDVILIDDVDDSVIKPVEEMKQLCFQVSERLSVDDPIKSRIKSLQWMMVQKLQNKKANAVCGDCDTTTTFSCSNKLCHNKSLSSLMNLQLQLHNDSNTSSNI